ncbi:MAG TPA: Xaa-Pro peptidase family protein [Candidatus Acidoferrum sp.]|nr:Xaa-Pro peptidase family protein [Candidatus Acidoferrum sp.]
MDRMFANRRRALQRRMAEEKLDRLVLTHSADWYYLTGFTGDSGALVVSRETGKGAAIITDGRFTAQAGDETSGVRIVKQLGALYSSVGKYLLEGKGRRVGFDPGQLTVGQHSELLRATGKRVAWQKAPGLTARLRMRKEPVELAVMRRAARVADEVMAAGAAMLKPGVREFEVAAEIEYQMKKRGASGVAFETIVAFGSRAALPHARATAKRLKKNELVVLDLGAILAHYCSDITRTYYVGRASSLVRGWYGAVLEAQAAAIAAVRNGASCGEVDAAARNVLAGHKLDRYFVHSTGHGLGLEVHEDPRIAKGQARLLEAGNVITIEPGVYFPGIGGIRIEDDVAVHASRSEVLTRVSRDFTEL